MGGSNEQQEDCSDNHSCDYEHVTGSGTEPIRPRWYVPARDLRTVFVHVADELIANPRNRLDESSGGGLVSECVTDLPNPLCQGVLADVDARPDRVKELFLANDPASVLDEVQQEVERFRRKVQLLIRVKQTPLSAIEDEAAKPKEAERL
jgi:hypothetical protein